MLKEKTRSYPSNEAWTEEYLKKFNRGAVLKSLVTDPRPVIFDTEISFYDFYEKEVSFYDIERIVLPAGFRLWDISHISKNPMNGRTDWVDVIYNRRRSA